MALTVALIHGSVFPVSHYGGTERVGWWLAKGLQELGVQVKLVCKAGSTCPFAEVIPVSGSFPPPNLPKADVTHFFDTPIDEPRYPYLVTIHGNGKAGEKFQPNTVFLSRDHAKRHGATHFVYNGLDPSDYEFRPQKENQLLFLSKASWRVKNVKGAIQIAKKSKCELNIVGGKRFLFNHWQGIHWRGMLGGKEKADYLSRAKGLLFPVLWPEPFGLAVTEAMVSGTPVLASPFGSLPELVSPSVGKICKTFEDFLHAVESLGQYRPEDCREWVMEKFHYKKMAASYLEYYQRILSGEKLHQGPVQTLPDNNRYLI